MGTAKIHRRSTGGAEFPGALRGGPDRADEGGAQAGVLEGLEAGDGGTAGAGDLIAKLGGMQAGLEDHGGGAKDGLRGEPEGDVARQPHQDASVGKRLDDGVHEGRAAPAQARDRIEQFLLYPDNDAGGAEDALGCRHVFRGGAIGGGIGGGALADEGRGVRHDADEARIAGSPLAEPAEGHARCDGEEEFSAQVAGFAERGGDVAGLDAKDEQGGVFRYLEIGYECLGTGSPRKIPGGGREFVCEEDVGGGGDGCAEDALEEGGGHPAAADEADLHGRVLGMREGRVQVQVEQWRRNSHEAMDTH